MSEKINSAQVIKKGIGRTILNIVAIILGTILFSFGLLQLPIVQTMLAQKFAKEFSKKLGYRIEVEYLGIKNFDSIVLENVLIKDRMDSLMIRAQDISIDFELKSVIDATHRTINQVTLNNGSVHLIRYMDTDSLNLNHFISKIRKLTLKQTNKKKPEVSIDDVSLNNVSFHFNDLKKDSIISQFDYNHFSLDSITSNISKLRVMSDTVEMNILNLSCKEPNRGFDIHRLKSYFRFSAKSMEFHDLNLAVGKSVLKDSLIFKYNGSQNLSYFVDSVDVFANLENTKIYSQDLALFAPYFKPFYEYYSVSGEFKGKVNHFSAKKLAAHLGRNTHFYGDASFDGLPNIQSTFIDARLSRSEIHADDIRKYIRPALYDKLKTMGAMKVNAQFVGFTSDFVTKGSFITDIGKLESDLNFKIKEKTGKIAYNGHLVTNNFNLGAFLENSNFQFVDMNGQINGVGSKLENANFDLKASIKRIGINNYEYKNIETDAQFAKELFKGKASINDPNIKFNADGFIDLRNNLNQIKIKAHLESAILQNLNLSEKPAFVSTDLDIDIHGLKLNDIVGSAKFKNGYITYDFRELNFDSLDINSKLENGMRELNINSGDISANLTGNFNFDALVKDGSILYKEYLLNILNDKEKIDKYYASKEIDSLKNYTLKYDLDLLNANPYINLINENIQISKKSKVKGLFKKGYTSILTMSTTLDSVSYKNNIFTNTFIDISASKIADSTNVLAVAYVNSESQNYNNVTEFKNLSFEGIWNNNLVDFEAYTAQKNTSNDALVRGHLKFLENRTEISFERSDFNIIGKEWKIDNNNLIAISNRKIDFTNIELFHDEQKLSIIGTISDSAAESLNIRVENFQIENINPLMKTSFFGELNGQAKVQDFYHELFIESELALSNFKVSNFAVGDVLGTSQWDNENKYMLVNLEIDRDDIKTVDIKGYLIPKDENQLKLNARFNETNLNVLEPFIKNYFTNIRGLASGDFTVTGRLDSPILKGNGIVKGGNIKVNYLNVEYSFEGPLYFDENEIGTRSLKLHDRKNNVAYLSGGVFHDGFKNFVLDLTGNITNFELLNTQANNNELYYGNAFGTGTVNFLGAINNLTISANAKSNKGTKIFIPIGETSDIVEQGDFIHFVQRDSSIVIPSEDDDQQVKITGLKLDFDLELTPDAYCEIIFDIKSGDIIRGRGNGKLKLQIDTKGDFNMFGDYTLLEGGYNFTLYNIINKEFEIQSGSKISWYGDPYKGIMDIDASYKQLASMEPLIRDANPDLSNEEAPEIRRRYPSTVQLGLDGELLSPRIKFNIDVDVSDYPDNINVGGTPISLQAAASAFKAKINDDEQFLNRQVFSLVILRKFYADNGFTVGSTLTSSVSELLSNQLSYWVSQVDDNLEIDLDLNNLDEDALNTFQLRLSYTFLEGRLRVTRDGNFTKPDNTADISSIAGDWSVEYLLSADGKFRAKMYSRNNYYTFDDPEFGSNSNERITTGFSILHTQSFDEIKELFTNRNKKDQNEKELKDKKKEPARPEEELTPPLADNNQ